MKAQQIRCVPREAPVDLLAIDDDDRGEHFLDRSLSARRRDDDATLGGHGILRECRRRADERRERIQPWKTKLE